MATSMTLADLREYVRTQTQTTSAELPNTTVDIYLQEAFDRTIAMENQWPFFEETWALYIAREHSRALGHVHVDVTLAQAVDVDTEIRRP